MPIAPNFRGYLRRVRLGWAAELHLPAHAPVHTTSSTRSEATNLLTSSALETTPVHYCATNPALPCASAPKTT